MEKTLRSFVWKKGLHDVFKSEWKGKRTNFSPLETHPFLQQKYTTRTTLMLTVPFLGDLWSPFPPRTVGLSQGVPDALLPVKSNQKTLEEQRGFYWKDLAI